MLMALLLPVRLYIQYIYIYMHALRVVRGHRQRTGVCLRMLNALLLPVNFMYSIIYIYISHDGLLEILPNFGGEHHKSADIENPSGLRLCVSSKSIMRLPRTISLDSAAGSHLSLSLSIYIYYMYYICTYIIRSKRKVHLRSSVMNLLLVRRKARLPWSFN